MFSKYLKLCVILWRTKYSSNLCKTANVFHLWKGWLLCRITLRCWLQQYCLKPETLDNVSYLNNYGFAQFLNTVFTLDLLHKINNLQQERSNYCSDFKYRIHTNSILLLWLSLRNNQILLSISPWTNCEPISLDILSYIPSVQAYSVWLCIVPADFFFL